MGLSNQNLGMPLSVVSGGTGADLSATGGTSKFLKQASAGAVITVAQPATTDLSDVSTWTDYSSSSTVVGWSSFTRKTILCNVIGKLLIVQYSLIGTSNATTVSFTLPNNAITNANLGHIQLIGQLQNSGVYIDAKGLLSIGSNTSTVNCYREQ
jgi:hypothetical protein